MLLLLGMRAVPPAAAAGEDGWDGDLIRGHNTLIFRSFSDRVFSGTDVRREHDFDRYTLYNYLTIQKLHIFEDENLRVFGSGTAWYRQELNDHPFHTNSDRLELSFGAVQIDRGRTSDGFIKLGRIYNYRGILHQRFDGGEIYYPLTDWFDIDVYGGRRPYKYTEGADDTWLTGGRAGLNFARRSTIGLSWLLAKTDGQWDDQKIGGDWRFMPLDWLELSGFWGYDQISDEVFEIQTQAKASAARDLDFRFLYDYIIPGLYIPKSSIFSVYSLAEEESVAAQVVYRPGRQWTFLADITHIDYGNEGGMGGPNNFFTEENALDGGYQWRHGFEIAYRHNPYDEVSLRFEQMLEGNYGYTVTDLIRTNTDFRDYDIFNPPPEDEGFLYGELENGFSSIGLHHWHAWSAKFSHAFNFYYYLYDNPLFLHRSGDDSFSTNLTLNYKFNRDWQISAGGRYLNSLADEAETQFYTRLTFHF